MKNYKLTKIYLLVVFTVFLLFPKTYAQLSLPQPSPKAMVMQTVGITEVTIEYSSPGIKGRKVWGELVPYDSMWRAGANSPTKIEFSTDVKINNKDLKKGKYTLIAIPKKGADWEFILNNDSKGNGVFSYQKSDDVIRFAGKVNKMKKSQERLSYTIVADTDTEGTVSLNWEKISVSFKVQIPLKKELDKSIAGFMRSNWFSLADAADFYIKNNPSDEDKKMAGQLADASIAMAGENLFNLWVKAKVMSSKNEIAEAKKLAKKVKEMGEKSEGGWKGFYNRRVKPEVEESLKTWK